MKYILVAVLLVCCVYANPQEPAFKRKVDHLKAQNIQNILAAQNFTCHMPQPRVVAIEEFHKTSPQLLYIPHSTVLHRCGQDTGCCRDAQSSCQPINQKEVHIVFNVHDISTHAKSMITLTAYNHTLCGCDNFRVLPG